MKKILTIENLLVNCKYQAVLQDINLNVHAGEILSIVGESGSGKSTLLKTIMQLLPDNYQVRAGRILFKGRNLLELNKQELRRLRGAQIGMVFQNSAAALSPLRTVGAQIEESVRAHFSHSRQMIYTMAMQLLANLELAEPERIWHSYPFELSGGMNQRLGIAMAALLQPELLLADEPTSALDIMNQAQAMQELQSLQQSTGVSIILVTHNISLIAKFADTIAVMQQGQIVECGRAASIINNPQVEYTQSLLKAVPRIKRS